MKILIDMDGVIALRGGVKPLWKKHAPKVYLVGELNMWTACVGSLLLTRWVDAAMFAVIAGAWSNWRTNARQRREGTDRDTLLKDRARFARVIRLVADPKTRAAALAVIDSKPRLWDAS